MFELIEKLVIAGIGLSVAAVFASGAVIVVVSVWKFVRELQND